ncbi:MAG: hypothetical protein ACLQVK_07800 [Acidimicrobiales bacterium]
METANDWNIVFAQEPAHLGDIATHIGIPLVASRADSSVIVGVVTTRPISADFDAVNGSRLRNVV